MFDELKNLNFAKCSGAELKTLICQIIPDLQAQAARELFRRFDNNRISQPIISGPSNGCKFPPDQLDSIVEENFDVILDVRNNSLRYRKDPTKHTSLKESKHKKIGPHRMRFLAFMLEHPDYPFHCENIYRVYGDIEEIKTASAFSKTIAALRDAFEQKDTSGPYIVKQPDVEGATGLKRGYIYKINPKWKYRVIRHQNEISEHYPSQFRAGSELTDIRK